MRFLIISSPFVGIVLTCVLFYCVRKNIFALHWALIVAPVVAGQLVALVVRWRTRYRPSKLNVPLSQNEDSGTWWVSRLVEKSRTETR